MELNLEKKPTKIRIGLYFEKETYLKLQKVAKKYNRSASDVAEQIILVGIGEDNE